MITAIYVSPNCAAKVQKVSYREDGIKELLCAKEIETLHPYDKFPNLAILLEKDATAHGKPFCRVLTDQSGKVIDLLYGSFVIVNKTEFGFTSLTGGQIKHFLGKFSQPEAISVQNGCLKVIKVEKEQKGNPLLHKLYNGDYNPSRCKINDKGYNERLDAASDLLDNLVSKLSPQQRLMLDDYLSRRTEAQRYAENLIFIEGIKIAKAISDTATQ